MYKFFFALVILVVYLLMTLFICGCFFNTEEEKTSLCSYCGKPKNGHGSLDV